MKRRLALGILVVGLLSAELALAGVISGEVTARDKEKQLVQMYDGSVYFVPNRVWLSDLRPGRWATIWYTERDGLRIVIDARRNDRKRFGMR